jgi:hypothetical protein
MYIFSLCYSLHKWKKKHIEVRIVTGIILHIRHPSGSIFSSIEKNAYVNNEEHHAESLRYTL